MLHRLCLLLAVLVLTGCTDSRPPAVPVDPVPPGVVLPAGMPNDNWFYQNVVQSPVPVLVDFTATWCGPCQAMKPSLHKIETAYGSRVKVVEVDVDERPHLSDHFQVKGIPRLMIIQDGAIQEDASGLHTYDEIVSLLNSTAGRP